MRTLITVSNPDFKQSLFSQEALNKLSAVSEVDWIPEGGSFTSEQLVEQISVYDAVITTWGSPKLTKEVLAKAARL
ncbi:MAG: hydroxyacid dehydrogenase, partial [Paenibacillus sp.]|nr:hydroxyacid dehydrogenase [Paenibacillus sp.]